MNASADLLHEADLLLVTGLDDNGRGRASSSLVQAVAALQP